MLGCRSFHDGDCIRVLSLSSIIRLVNHRACAIAGGLPGLLVRLLRLDHFLNTSHGIRPLPTEALGIKLPNEFRQRQLPGLLVVVVQLPELLGTDLPKDMRALPIWRRARCAKSSTRTKSNRTKCDTTWNSAIPTLREKWPRCCAFIAR